MDAIAGVYRDDPVGSRRRTARIATASARSCRAR
jgi:hypothetical protein